MLSLNQDEYMFIPATAIDWIGNGLVKSIMGDINNLVDSHRKYEIYLKGCIKWENQNPKSFEEWVSGQN